MDLDFSKLGEVIIFGPGKQEMAHKVDEYIEINNLEKFHDAYKEIMQNF